MCPDFAVLYKEDVKVRSLETPIKFFQNVVVTSVYTEMR
jgi:hypothetical protein